MLDRDRDTAEVADHIEAMREDIRTVADDVSALGHHDAARPLRQAALNLTRALEALRSAFGRRT